jgi:hypothetical protein
VYDEQVQFPLCRVAQFLGLGSGPGIGDDHISQIVPCLRGSHERAGFLLDAKGQHVGRAILAQKIAIELADALVIGDDQRHLARTPFEI